MFTITDDDRASCIWELVVGWEWVTLIGSPEAKTHKKSLGGDAKRCEWPVRGPDASVKGNLLTPLAEQQGDPRAAMELLRRGRRVLFVPDSTQYMDADAFQRFLSGLDEK
jgi:hypothetical protein